MKRILPFLMFAVVSQLGFSQCTPDYDFQDAEFGVYPDPEQGQTFDNAILGEPYENTIHLLTPTDAGAVDDLYAGVAIDSITLTAVTLILDGTSYAPQELGLDFACNNGLVSDNPCTIFAGQQGCGSIFGTPTTAGLFNVEVTATVHVTIIGNAIGVPFNYEGYTLLVEENVVSVDDLNTVSFSVAQNKPNPFNGQSSIDFQLASPGEVNITVMNLLGAEVMSRKINGLRGKNTFVLDAAYYQPGVYLYRLEKGGNMATYRMVVSK